MCVCQEKICMLTLSLLDELYGVRAGVINSAKKKEIQKKKHDIIEEKYKLHLNIAHSQNKAAGVSSGFNQDGLD